jgi:tyrosine-protein kinase
MELRQYLRVLRAHRGLVAASVLACTAVAAALAWGTSSTYSSQAQLFVATNGGADDTGATYQAGLFSQERVLSYVQMVSSPAVLDAVIDQLDLHETSRDLAGRIKASVPTGTVLLDITAEDGSPERAAALAQAAAQQFIIFASRLEKPPGAKSSRVTISVTNPAQLPTSPSAPRKSVYLAFGVLFGLALGVGGAFLREALDRRVRSEDDAAAAARAPVLASVAERGSAKGRPLVVISQPASARAESYRRLRANLGFLIDDDDHRSVVVSSVFAGDGKEVVVANLGAAFALAGRRVVVVDADPRSGALASLFGVERSPGLAELLQDDLPLASVLKTADGEVPLTVVAAGGDLANPSDVLASKRLPSVVAELAERFEFVLIAAPPLLEFADAAVLARGTSGAVVVAHAGSTRPDDLAAAVESLRAIDVRVFGVVLNQGKRRGRSRVLAPRSRGRGHVRHLSTVESEGLQVP